MSHPGRRDGFTLLELIIVLILLGLAAAVVIPSFTGGLRGLRLETAGRDLITRMKQARTDALSQQAVFRVVLKTDPAGDDQYVFVDEYGRTLRSYNLPEDVVVKTPEKELPLTISFYPSGKSSGGKFSLQYEGGRVLRISVDPVTGFGRVLKATEIMGEQ
jgi:prepilin-type N-terminal cleavage/methylation domain-containing protein